MGTREAVTALQELQVRRRHYIRTGTRLTNSIGALLRRALGWTPDGAEADAITRRAGKIVGLFLAKGEVAEADAGLATALATDLLVARRMIAIAEEARRDVEREMVRLARALPAYPWVKGVPGFGDLGFAVLVGEAGDVGSYATHERLWKRLGLAPHAGRAGSSWRARGGLAAEDWLRFGYAPRRRAEVYAVIEEPLFRIQASRSGPYHAAYLARRARTAETHPDWTKGHSHQDAKRVMVKRLVLDLWSEWRRAVDAKPDAARDGVPACALLPALDMQEAA